MSSLKILLYNIFDRSSLTTVNTVRVYYCCFLTEIIGIHVSPMVALRDGYRKG
jgi:hypothetical protein